MATLSKPEAIERLFEATLDALADIDAFSGPKSPTSFVIYAHDAESGDDGLGPGYSDSVKTLIAWLRRVRNRTLSDQNPAPLFGHESRLSSGESACRDILENQFCLLPRAGPFDSDATIISSVDTVLVCGTPRLKSYCTHPFATKYINAIKREYETNSSLAASELRKNILDNVLVPAVSQPGFHHALTEIALLELRQERSKDAKGVVVVSFDKELINYLQIPRPTTLHLNIDAFMANEKLHGRFFKLLRLLHTDKHAAILAYEAAYKAAKIEIDEHHTKLIANELDILCDKVLSQARRQLAHHENAEIRQLYQRKQLAELNRAAYDDLERRRIAVLRTLPTLFYKDCKDRNPDRVVGTCRWFTAHSKFRDWQNGDTGGLLWVTAYPECGKSVLLKYLAETVLVGKNRTVCYFFFKDDSEHQRSLAGAFRCLLHQLLLQRPELLTAEKLREFEQDDQLLTSPGGLWHILLDLSQSAETGDVVLVIDALDECDPDDRLLLMQWLVALNEETATLRLKCVVSSRLYLDISRGFRKIQNKIHLSGENDVELRQISAEIDLVIDAKLRDLAIVLDLSEKSLDLLRQELRKVSHKTYLWVYLVIHEISRSIETDSKSLKAIVSDLPCSVDEAYEKILGRSGSHSAVKKMLSIILAAAEPLNLQQLAEAWAVTQEVQTVADLKVLSGDQVRLALNGLCGLFVIVVDEKVHFLNQTAREFLLAGESKVTVQQGLANVWKGSIIQAEADLTMAQICFHYFRLLGCPAWTFDGSDHAALTSDNCVCAPTPQARHFLDCFAMYSLKEWAGHYLRSLLVGGEVSTQQALTHCERLRRVFEHSEDIRTETAEMGREPQEGVDSTLSVLMIASMLGLHPVVERLLQGNMSGLNDTDWTSTTAMGWAIHYDHFRVVKVLIHYGADCATPNYQGMPALSSAVVRKRYAIVELLLASATNVDQTDREGRTALWYAAHGDEIDMMQLILRQGASPDATDKWGVTPLMAGFMQSGSTLGPVGTVSLLLQHGANPAVMDRFGEGAVFYACQRGPAELIDILIKHGADLCAKNPRQETPLMRCIGSRHLEEDVKKSIAELLIRGGVDVNTPDNAGASPLFIACEQKLKTVVQLLLRHEATIDTVTIFGIIQSKSLDIMKTLVDVKGDLSQIGGLDLAPLSIAAGRGSLEFVQMFLRGGATIDQPDRSGRTALCIASKEGFAAVAQLLLCHGATIDWADSIGRTPLMHAAKHGREGVVLVLLLHGADPNRSDILGRTALSFAAMQGNPRLVRLLLAHGARRKVQSA